MVKMQVAGLTEAAISTVASFAARKIGASYQAGELEPVTHKVAHGLAAALPRMALGQTEEAISAGLGAAAVETVA